MVNFTPKSVKPTDKNTLLCYESAHPRKMVRSLPFSQLLRVQKIVTTDTEMEGALLDMSQKCIHQGYPRQLVNEHADRVCSLGSGSNSSARETERVPFISTFNEASPKISKILNK